MKMDISASIPQSYIPQESKRLELYKSIFSAQEQKELEEIYLSCTDRYGQPPGLCSRIFKMAELKLLANQIGVEKLKLNRPTHVEARFQSLKASELKVLLSLKDKQLDYLHFSEDFVMRVGLSKGSEILTDDAILDRAIARFSAIFHHIKAIGNDQTEPVY